MVTLHKKNKRKDYVESFAYRRPVDASTLIILNASNEVLLGKRSSKHVFMPEQYVFPGGRVDPGDSRVFCPIEAEPELMNELTETVSKARAKGIAMAAVRETFEETGLILGSPWKHLIQTKSSSWRPFFNLGMVPALNRLKYFTRAITPPGQVRRYDARFFLAEAKSLTGELQSNGELIDLRWINIEQATSLPLSPITNLVLQVLQERQKGNNTHPSTLLKEIAGAALRIK